MQQNREHRAKTSKSSPKDDKPHSGLLELVEELASIVKREELSEVRIRDGEIEVQVSRKHPEDTGVSSGNLRAGASVESALTPVDANETVGSRDSELINAPMPSRFYRSPGPDEPPFIEVGDTVNPGDSLAILEVMKTYNPVEAPFNCEILEILAEDGDSVEYAQPLFRVRRS